MSEIWWDYVQRITGRAQQKEIADATGVESSISRWKLGKNGPKAEAAVAVARGYNRNPVEALIAAGYLNAEEIDGVVEISLAVHDLSPDEIVLQMDSLIRALRGRIVDDMQPAWGSRNWRGQQADPDDLSESMPRLGQG